MLIPVELLVYVLRVLSTILYTGAFTFIVFEVLPQLGSIPPGERVYLLKESIARYLPILWLLVVLMVVTGIIFAQLVGTVPRTMAIDEIILLLSSSHGMILLAEAIVSLLIIISGVLMTFLIYSKRMNVSLRRLDSPADDRLKWVVCEGGIRSLKASLWLIKLCWLNLFLGGSSIVLGITFRFLAL